MNKAFDLKNRLLLALPIALSFSLAACNPGDQGASSLGGEGASSSPTDPAVVQ